MSVKPEDRPLDRPEARRSLLLMCLLAVATGIIAGTGAWAFRMMIGLVHNVLFLGEPSIYYDANVHTPANPWGWGRGAGTGRGKSWRWPGWSRISLPTPRGTASPR